VLGRRWLRAWGCCLVWVSTALLATVVQAQCGITLSCGPEVGGDGSIFDIGVDTGGERKPCAGVCILSDQGRRQFELQNNCYFSDEYCGGTSQAHHIDRKTQCCGKDPTSGKPATQDKQISRANDDFNWDNYVKSCPKMRQSEGNADALWPQCKAGQKHHPEDHWVVQEVEVQPGNGNARPYCIDGCSTPPAAIEVLYRSGWFIYWDKDNPTGAGPGGYGSGSSFYQACAVHDRCYQTCSNASRQTCDDNILADMLRVCNSIPVEHVTTFTNNLGFQDDENTRDKCQSAANRMHTGLRIGGGSAFDTRRQQYCQCC